jgi:hypothetical protein
MDGLPVDMDDQAALRDLRHQSRDIAVRRFHQCGLLQDEMGIIKHFGSDFKTNAIVLYLVL